MAHSTKKLKRMVDRQRQRIEAANEELELARSKEHVDAEQIARLVNAIRSHRANVVRWQRELDKRALRGTAEIEKSSRSGRYWNSANHTAAEKRSSKARRENAWKLKEAQRCHDILRRSKESRDDAQRLAGVPGLDWSETSRA